MAATGQVFVIVHKSKKGGASLAEVHSTKESADAAAEALDDVMVKKMELKSDAAAPKASRAKAYADNYAAAFSKSNKGLSTANTKAKTTSKRAAPESEEEDDDVDEDVDADEEEAPPAKKAAPKKAAAAKKTAKDDNPRKTVPEGKPGALKGLKIVFTGTFDSMDRATQKATAEKYGAKVISKLEDTDYVILGVKAGEKKLDIIKSNDLETVDEDGFFDLLKNGVPQDKRDAMDAKAEAEPPKTKKAKK